MAEAKPKYWIGRVPELDDFGIKIEDEFIDGATKRGPWATMTPASFKRHGYPEHGFGMGKAQRYKKQDDGKFLKVEG